MKQLATRWAATSACESGPDGTTFEVSATAAASRCRRPRSRHRCSRPSACSWSFDHFGLGAPLMYQFEPLSARIIPYVFSACATMRACGGSDAMSTLGLQPHAQAHRRQRRIGRAARVVARGVDVRAPRALGGEAQRVADRARSTASPSQRARPGRIGSPAASADVQPAGRRAFERRFQIAPDQAAQLPLCCRHA